MKRKPPVRKRIALTEQETEDLASAVSIALESKKHKDSPNFQRALKRLDKKVWDVCRSFR